MTPDSLEIRPGVTSGKGSTDVTLAPPASSLEQPPLFVPRDELFFWSCEWQEGERESADARARDQLRVFESARELLDWLDTPED